MNTKILFVDESVDLKISHTSLLKVIFFEKLPLAIWFSNTRFTNFWWFMESLGNSQEFLMESLALNSYVSWIMYVCKCRFFGLLHGVSWNGQFTVTSINIFSHVSNVFNWLTSLRIIGWCNAYNWTCWSQFLISQFLEIVTDQVHFADQKFHIVCSLQVTFSTLIMNFHYNNALFFPVMLHNNWSQHKEM